MNKKFKGVPGVILGRNDWIAWGATSVGADVQGLLSVQLCYLYMKSSSHFVFLFGLVE
jgi:hypothetical protein